MKVNENHVKQQMSSPKLETVSSRLQTQLTLAIYTHSNSMMPSIKLGLPKKWECTSDQNASCRPCHNAEFMNRTGQVHTTILIGYSTSCHAMFHCSSGCGNTSLVHSLVSDSLYLNNRLKKIEKEKETCSDYTFFFFVA
jgi:hypothetical protein